MSARPNSEDQESGAPLEDQQAERRTKVRYHLAQLLLSEKFDEALHEALKAWSQEEIHPCDLEFVVEIIRSAERNGTATIDRERFPEDWLSQAMKSVASRAIQHNPPSA